jgi:CTP-dependent riboflavin kinase
VVEMDEIAVHFEMRTQDAIKRIEDLLMMGRIHGVIDDRGKFICVTEDEMKAVAKYMKRRGRVSVMDLAVESNKLIDLTPKRKVTAAEESTDSAPAAAAAAN